MNKEVNFIENSINDFQKIDDEGRVKILNYLDDNIKNGNPRRFGRALKGKVFRFWKYNVGNYNLICHLKDREITVLSVSEKLKKSS